MASVDQQLQLYTMEKTQDTFQEIFDTSLEVSSLFSSKTFNNLLQKYPQLDYGLGCVFGACIGDALGSYCQFSAPMKDYQMDQVMKMHGGGTFATKPGQFTDDSELALHLMHGIAQAYMPKVQFTKQIDQIILQIAKGYLNWYTSKPFDCGMTCSAAFGRIAQHKIQNIQKDDENLSKSLQNLLFDIGNANRNSQSNGSLMRISPMSFFLGVNLNKFSEDSVKQLIRKQIKLTHSDPCAIEASQIWARLQANIIGCVYQDQQKRLQVIRKIYKQVIDQPVHIKQWVEEAKKQDFMCSSKNQGWGKIAWSMGINRLRDMSESKVQKLNSEYYKETLRQVIQGGGDTDTNAAIVGGLVGAVIGFKNLPKQYLDKAFALRMGINPTRCDRPKFYQPSNMFLNCMKLFRKVKNI